jgi:hypothetical protein
VALRSEAQDLGHRLGERVNGMVWDHADEHDRMIPTMANGLAVAPALGSASWLLLDPRAFLDAAIDQAMGPGAAMEDALNRGTGERYSVREAVHVIADLYGALNDSASVSPTKVDDLFAGQDAPPLEGDPDEKSRPPRWVHMWRRGGRPSFALKPKPYRTRTGQARRNGDQHPPDEQGEVTEDE